MKRVSVEQKPYPVDNYGFPIDPHELGLFAFNTGETENNHHKAWQARKFGGLAISQTFRNLESEQTLMPISEHNRLHRLFSGIELPPLVNMLDRIETEMLLENNLKIRTDRGYVYHPITEVHWATLMAEYNEKKE